MTTVGAAATTAATGSATSAKPNDAISKLSSDFNNFLTLLTTQLKNQDPMAPMDSTQFTQQLVAFTGVEQQINTNTKLDTMIGLDKQGQLTAAAGFIGDQIEATSGQLWLPADGSGSAIGYTLPDGTTTAAMAIYDANGNIVRSGVVPVAQGHNVVAWDGKNNNDTAMASGLYSFSIQGLDKDGKPVTDIATSTVGTVTNVSSDATNGTLLSIGNLTVPMSAVLSIKKPS